MVVLFCTFETGYCGSETHEVYSFDEHPTDKALEDFLWNEALQNAESFGYYLCSEDCEDEECEDEHPGSTSIAGYCEVYDPDLHDMYSSVGKWTPFYIGKL